MNDANNEIGTLSKSFEDVLYEAVTHIRAGDDLFQQLKGRETLHQDLISFFLEGSGSETFILHLRTFIKSLITIIIKRGQIVIIIRNKIFQ